MIIHKHIISLIVLFAFFFLGADCVNNPDPSLHITQIKMDDRNLNINDPNNVERNINLTPVISISFSKKIDLNELKSNVKLSKDAPDAETISLTITKVNDTTGKIILSNNHVLEKNTTYTITITKDIKSVVQGIVYTVPAEITLKFVTISLAQNPSVFLYTGSETKAIGPAIVDAGLADFAVATITDITSQNHTISFGTLSITKTPINGSFTIMKSDLVNTNAAGDEKLTISYGNQIVEIATYKPYELYTWQDVQAMRNDLSGNYVLMKDVTFPELSEDGFQATGFEPIGKDTGAVENYQGDAFSGTLDGNNKVITNFAIRNESMSYAGLFGKILHNESNVDVLKNVVFKGVRILAKAIAGTVAGYLERGRITNVGVELEERNRDTIRTTGTDRFHNLNASFTGGLVGLIEVGSEVKNCYNHVPVKASSNFVGGLVGYSDGSLIGYSTGDISGNNTVGGLAGYCSPLSTKTIGYATGDVTGNSLVGGLTGTTMFSQTVMVLGYALGNVSAESNAGGLWGLVATPQATGYARGTVTRVGTGTDGNFGALVPTRQLQGFYSKGFYSGKPGESTVSAESGTLVPHASGTRITVDGNTRQTDFNGFDFVKSENNPVPWVWIDGRWPALDFGTSFLPAPIDQPTVP